MSESPKDNPQQENEPNPSSAVNQKKNPSPELIEKLCLKMNYKYPELKEIIISYMTDFKAKKVSLPKIVFYLSKYDKHEYNKILVNKMMEKYLDEGYFYIPQFCVLLNEKKFTESLESYLLDQCIHRIKFSLYVYWIINSYSVKNEKLNKFLSTVEMTLVNGSKLLNSNKEFKQRARTEKEIFQHNIDKGLRVDYYNTCIHFYSDLKKLCEDLKKFPKENKSNPKLERSYQFQNGINNFNKKIKKLCTIDENIPNTSRTIQGFYRGLILPFNDSESISDDDCNVIVKFEHDYSVAISTKARVPCKLVFQCVKVKDLAYWEKYYVNPDNKGRRNSIQDYIDFVDGAQKFQMKNIGQNNINNDNNLINNNFNNDNNINNNFNNNINNDNDKDSDSKSDSDSDNENVIKFVGHITQPLTLNAYRLINFNNEFGNPFGSKWVETCDKIMSESPFRNFPSLSIKSFIAKSDDDLRQESLTMQVIKTLDSIFYAAHIPIKLRPYEIIITSKTSGLIEFIPDTLSIDALKKKTKDTDLDTFYRRFFSKNFIEAQRNFVESLAGYCIVTYILNLKDRHNGNILVDMQGHIIHIDFGFILGISPGNMNFETAPFKITKEYIKLMDGVDSDMYTYFIMLLIRGFKEIKKHFETFVKIIEIMSKNSDMPCFKGRDPQIIIKDFLERFQLHKNDDEYEPFVKNLMKEAIGSWRTYEYDKFQQFTNGIRP